MPDRRRFRPRAPRTIALRAERPPIGIEVREVAGAKRLRLRIRQDGTVHVTVPPRTSERRIDGFIAENEPWLDRALADHEARSGRLGLAVAGRVPLAGELIPVVRTPAAGPRAVLEVVGGETVVAVSGPPASAAGTLERLLREEARLCALELLALHEPAVGVRPSRVRISDPLTRWGSASTRGTLSFSGGSRSRPPSSSSTSRCTSCATCSS